MPPSMARHVPLVQIARELVDKAQSPES